MYFFFIFQNTIFPNFLLLPSFPPHSFAWLFFLCSDPDYKPSPSETRICDFDNASFLVKVEESDLARVYVSLSLPCYSEIKNMGARDAVEAAFPGLISPETEAGYDFTISVGKSDYEGKETEMIEKLANMKSITLGGVFEKYYKALNDKNTSSLSNFKFNLRPDTTIYIIPNADRIYTTFQLSFMDKSDMEIGKVFLTEFADPAQRRKVQRAPLVSYDITPPSHLKPFGVETINKADLGFVSFTVLDMHVTDAVRSIPFETHQVDT